MYKMSVVFNSQRALEQIKRGVVVRIKRFDFEDIEALSKPKRRNAKKRFESLAFNDQVFFEKASGFLDNPFVSNSERSSKKHSNKRRKVFVDDEFFLGSEDRINFSPLSLSESSEVEKLPCVEVDSKTSNEPPVAALPTRNELKSDCKSQICSEKRLENEELKTSVVNQELESPFPNISLNEEKDEERKVLPSFPDCPRLWVKSPKDLGCSIIFIDDEMPNHSKIDNSKNVIDLSDCDDLEMEQVCSLYKTFFNYEIQLKIKEVGKILRQMDQDAKAHHERINEITGNRVSTDAEKLMQRHSTFKEHANKREAKKAVLLTFINPIIESFSEDNYQMLCQLLVLGILKAYLNSGNPLKSGIAYKNLTRQLITCLDDAKYEKLISVIKHKNFRFDCIALVQLVEKCCKNDFFKIFYTSDEKEKLILEGKRESFFVKSNTVNRLDIRKGGNNLLRPKRVILLHKVINNTPLQVGSAQLSKTGTIPNSSFILLPRANATYAATLCNQSITTNSISNPSSLVSTTLTNLSAPVIPTVPVTKTKLSTPSSHQPVPCFNPFSTVSPNLNRTYFQQPTQTRTAVLQDFTHVNNENIMPPTPTVPEQIVPKVNSSIKKCAYKSCSKEAIVVCSGCNHAVYCGTECQKLDWACGHIKTCKQLLASSS